MSEFTVPVSLQKDLVEIRSDVKIHREEGENTTTFLDNVEVRGNFMYRNYGESEPKNNLITDMSRIKDLLAKRPPIVAKTIPILTWQKGVSYVLPLSMDPRSNTYKHVIRFTTGHISKWEEHRENPHYRKSVFDSLASMFRGSAEDRKKWFEPQADGKAPTGWMKVLSGNDSYTSEIVSFDLDQFVDPSTETGLVSEQTISNCGRIVATRLLDGSVVFHRYTGKVTASPSLELHYGRVVCVARLAPTSFLVPPYVDSPKHDCKSRLEVRRGAWDTPRFAIDRSSGEKYESRRERPYVFKSPRFEGESEFYSSGKNPNQIYYLKWRKVTSSKTLAYERAREQYYEHGRINHYGARGRAVEFSDGRKGWKSYVKYRFYPIRRKRRSQFYLEV